MNTIEKKVRRSLDSVLNISTSINDNSNLYPVRIAVIDTGLTIGHFLSKTLRNPSSSNLKNTKHGHGVHVHGIINSLNPSAELYHYNFYSSNDTIKSLIKNIYEAIEDDVKIINISIEGKNPSIAEEKALRLARDHGIIIVVAAGNSGNDIADNPSYPASYKNDHIIPVANYDKNGFIYKSSNYGDSVFIGALGVNIPSYCAYEMNKVCYLTGTSQAAPIISSAISIILQKFPYAEIEDVKDILYINSYGNVYDNTQAGMFNFDDFKKWINTNDTLPSGQNL